LHLTGAIVKEAITFEPLEVQLQRRASARLLESRLQVNAAFCARERSNYEDPLVGLLGWVRLVAAGPEARW
jgi:hypothetical protein